MRPTLPFSPAMLLAIGLAGIYIWTRFRPGAFNPASRENIIYKATGEVGLKIADRFPSAAERKVAEMLKVTPTIKAGSGYELSPASFGTTSPTEKRPAYLPLYGLGRWL